MSAKDDKDPPKDDKNPPKDDKDPPKDDKDPTHLPAEEIIHRNQLNQFFWSHLKNFTK